MVRIAFERSGGFAGITVRTSLDIADPTPAERKALEALRRIPAWRGVIGAEIGRDLFQYRVTVTDARSGRLYAFSEADVPDALRPLLERLAALAEGREPPGAG